MESSTTEKTQLEEVKESLKEKEDMKEIKKLAETGGQDESKMTENAKKIYLLIKTMTAMKLTRDDHQPAEVLERLFLGSIGAAFNKESLERN